MAGPGGGHMIPSSLSCGRTEDGNMRTIRQAAVAALGALMATLLVAPAPVALADDAVRCQVRNLTQDTAGASFGAMVHAAVDDDRLTVRGTCSGGVAIGNDLRISGVGVRPTLTGRGRYRVLLIRRGAVVRLRDLTITDGVGSWRSYSGSGGVYNCGSLTTTAVTVTRNQADSLAGGSLTSGSLVLRDSVVSANTAWSEQGGGIYTLGWLRVRATRITDNVSGWG